MCLATAALIAGTNESDLFGDLDNSGISTAYIAIFKAEVLCCSWTLEGSRGAIYKSQLDQENDFSFSNYFYNAFSLERK